MKGVKNRNVHVYKSWWLTQLGSLDWDHVLTGTEVGVQHCKLTPPDSAFLSVHVMLKRKRLTFFLITTQGLRALLLLSDCCIYFTFY